MPFCRRRTSYRSGASGANLRAPLDSTPTGVYHFSPLCNLTRQFWVGIGYSERESCIPTPTACSFTVKRSNGIFALARHRGWGWESGAQTISRSITRSDTTLDFGRRRFALGGAGTRALQALRCRYEGWGLHSCVWAR
jgi:hypothetical protein